MSFIFGLFLDCFGLVFGLDFRFAGGAARFVFCFFLGCFDDEVGLERNYMMETTRSEIEPISCIKTIQKGG